MTVDVLQLAVGASWVATAIGAGLWLWSWLREKDAIRKLPEVIACHYISGTGTFELQVVAQDLDSFSRFALGSLINLPNVKDLHTSFSLGEVKASTPLPLAHLGPRAGA